MDATRDCGLVAGESDGVIVEEDVDPGRVFDVVKTVLSLRIASLTDEEAAMGFPAVRDTGVAE